MRFKTLILFLYAKIMVKFKGEIQMHKQRKIDDKIRYNLSGGLPVI